MHGNGGIILEEFFKEENYDWQLFENSKTILYLLSDKKGQYLEKYF